MGTLLLAALLAGQAATAPTAAPAPASADARNKVKCKRELETGSLVKSKKTCRTVAEWESARREAREFGQQMQDGYKGQLPQ